MPRGKKYKYCTLKVKAILNQLLTIKGRSRNSTIRTTCWVTATTSSVVSISRWFAADGNHKLGGFHQQQTICKDLKKKKQEIKILHLQQVLKRYEHTHCQRNTICGEHHWVQKQEWPSEYTSCRSARDATGKHKIRADGRKQIHSLSTYTTTVSLLEHEGLQLELDLVFLGSRHEAWAGNRRIHKTPNNKWWQNSMLTRLASSH